MLKDLLKTCDFIAAQISLCSEVIRMLEHGKEVVQKKSNTLNIPITWRSTVYNNSVNFNGFNAQIDPNATQSGMLTPNNLFGQSYLGSYSTNMPVPSSLQSFQQPGVALHYQGMPNFNVHSTFVSNDRISQSVPLPAGVVSEVNDVDFREKVLNSAVPVIVKFEAQWCGPCKAMSPLLQKCAVDYAAQLRFARLDADSSEATTAAFNIRKLPTMILFENGREIRRIDGAQTPASLAAFIGNHSVA